ncbi:glycosyltransferase family 4 protein [Methylomonas montana]|uniref:glycosyltransferase family 4 protein n=1 Tax=Methylomonas montana TaxID=3058963 RepID=UPI002659C969|nr:glycosyltransferase family 4 protein [Methylomonas montana]WKJ92649.1 glycosyltransferase family 4 protein [Methylomonas montana]
MTDNSGIKKILYVENGIGYGGAIICLRHLVRNLDRTRYLPMVVTGRTGPQYEEIAHEALWKHIPDRHLDTVGLKAKAASIEWLSKRPALRFLVDQIIARADDLCNFLPFFLQLLWSAWRFKADLIHANNEPLCNRAALLVAKVLGIPSISHVRGDPGGSHSVHWTYSLPDQFISVSHWVANGMRDSLSIPAKKISVVYDGIALDQLDLSADGTLFRQQFNISKDAFAVGLVGLLIPWKGQHVFIDTAKILKTAIPNLKMLIIGGTPDDCIDYEAELKKRAIDEQLTDTVFFTGHICEMPNAYNGLDIVVSASTSPEPLGTVVIESMAIGCALIVPNHGGGAEMVEHNKTGLHFKSKDAASLAESILTLYKNPKVAQQLGHQAKSKALSIFSIEHHTQQIEKVYQNLLIQ